MNQQSQLFPPNHERILFNTSISSNERIYQKTVKTLEEIGDYKPHIEARLSEIEREWDIDRAIQAHAATVALISIGLGTFKDKKWFALTTLASAFLLNHATFGWCPPLPIFRRLGFRTQREIDNERAILKTRRGDFRHIGKSSDEILRALEK